MNKLIIALSVACASACVFADNAKPTPYEDLKLNAATGWFSATVENSAAKLDNLASSKQLTVEDSMIVIETDVDTMEAVTLSANAAATEDITTVTFEMLASTVPSENLVDMTGKGKIAFAISGEDTSRGFKAWLGGDKWVDISGSAPADDTKYTLIVRFDSRAGVNKVRFELEAGQVLGDGWYQYTGAPVTPAVVIDLVGSGKIASITGSQISIQAEVIDVGGLGKVVIPEEIAKEYKDPTEKAPGKSGVNVATAVALGIMRVENGQVFVDENVDFTIKADATARYADAIPVKFATFDASKKAGQTVISYQLMGSTDGTDNSYTVVGEAVSNIADVKIPATAIGDGKRYFKVVTKVSVNDPNNN